jgi:hypothetical protein
MQALARGGRRLLAVLRLGGIDHPQPVGVARARLHPEEALQALGEGVWPRRDVLATQAQDSVAREELEPWLQQLGIKSAREVRMRARKAPLRRNLALADRFQLERALEGLAFHPVHP